MLICHELDAKGTLIMGMHMLAVNMQAFLARIYILRSSSSFEMCINRKSQIKM